MYKYLLLNTFYWRYETDRIRSRILDCNDKDKDIENYIKKYGEEEKEAYVIESGIRITKIIEKRIKPKIIVSQYLRNGNIIDGNLTIRTLTENYYKIKFYIDEKKESKDFIAVFIVSAIHDISKDTRKKIKEIELYCKKLNIQEIIRPYEIVMLEK